MIQITIKKIERVMRPRTEWQKIADTGNEKDKGPIYGYATCEKEEHCETQILEQTVEELDLPAVIKAINKL